MARARMKASGPEIYGPGAWADRNARTCRAKVVDRAGDVDEVFQHMPEARMVLTSLHDGIKLVCFVVSM